MAWHILLFICFAAFGAFMGFLFFLKKRGNRFANNLLGTYSILFSLELLYNCLQWSGYMPTHKFIHFSFVHAPLWLTYGPLVYIYVRQVVDHKKILPRDVYFLFPILLLIVLIGPYYILGTAEKIEAWENGLFVQYVLLPRYSIWIIMGLMAFYGLLTLVRYGPRVKTGYRENKWLFWFVGSYFGYVLAFFAYIALTRWGLLNPNFDYFVDIIIVAFISALSFFGFVQPEVFEGKRVRELIPFIKYRKTGLSEALAMELKDKLETVMELDQPYLDPTLRMDDLAKSLLLSRNHTSQIINQYFNLSFFDFINKYRINAAKEMLAENRKDANITQIAYDAGFNNRASFYKAFKKFEGQTPTQYQNQSKAS